MKQLKDRVLEVSQTQGTGDYALAGAVTGFRAFSPAVNVGDTADYYAEEVDGTGVPSGAWETGMGTYAAGNKLQRTTIYASSNGGTPINWGVGTRRVAISLTSQTLADAVNAAGTSTAAAAAASASASASSSSASTSATSASQSAAARDAAIAAWAASTAPAEQLAAISQSLHVGAIVKAIIYDTAKDSDGGAWRKRCADKSWYTETLGGDRWIGQQATIAAAWAAAGSATGAVYQASATAGAQTSGFYYTPTSSTTVTQVYRGVTREFPAVAGIVAESGRVVIYDLATGAMWMVFTGAGGTLYGTMLGRSGCPRTALAALNGRVVSGGNAGTDYGEAFLWFDFTSDSARMGVDRFSQPISGRNSPVTTLAGVYAALVSYQVNDVAITVLDTAPIDAATGLPVPTIAVGTAGGTSIIQSDGTVTSVANAGGWFTKRLAFNKLGTLFGHGGDAAHGGLQPISYPPYTSIAAIGTAPNVGYPQIGALATGYGVTAANPYLLGGNNDSSIVIGGAVPSAKGLTLLKENPATPAKGMVAYVTKDYNSGWLPGDIRGAYLADTTAETVTASTLISSTFTGTGALDGWTLSATAVNNSGVNQLDITTGGASDRLVEFVSSTVSGKTYTVTLDTVTYSSVYVYQVNTSTAIGVTGAAGTYSFNFVAAGNNVLIILAGPGAGQRKIVDNISVKLAEPDRSVKNKGLVINGSLTKTAVASGAGLVAWSGFSAANYLEQPYNSDLDFGTGDFCVMGWYRVSSLSHDCTLFYRGAGVPSYAPAAGFNIWAQGGAVKTQIGGVTLESNYSLQAAAWILISVMRVSGVVYIHADGVLIGSGSNTSNLSGAQISRIGAGYWSGADHSLALWRIGATAPSADQLAHIYRTELPLFQAGAQCTIAGTSTAVTALAYDDVADTLHVGTSWGRSGFKDLLRVDSEATTTGGTTSLSANQGAILTGGTSGKYYQPALLLRDELRRKDEARKAMGRVQVALDFTATAAQTAFVCTKGYDVRSVYANGLLKRVGTDYTVSDDGFKKTVTFTAGQLVGVPVTAMLTRA